MASPRSPPQLMADLVSEILLRLPPEDPACLIRASLVCKTWLRLIYDGAFLRRYRAFHRAPPLLAFLACSYGNSEPRFIPFTSPTPFKPPAFVCSSRSRVMDCRRGRALLFDMWADSEGALSVWDPITGDRQVLPKPDCFYISGAALLCASAAAGCDHLDCRGGPFLVVCLGLSRGATDAHVYSSDTRSWSWGAQASVQLGADSFGEMNSPVVIGDEVYFALDLTPRILKYSLGKDDLSLIGPPDQDGGSEFVLMRTEDGSLGLAAVRDSNLYLWSRKVNPEGVAGWVICRVINLQTLFSIHNSKTTSVIGFTEGVEVIFVRTYVGMFAVELKSGKVKKVAELDYYFSVLPIMSFYTPDCGRCNHRHRLADL
ncbi:uncharacterized protein LOC120699468 [Panicum virgatum]|uniref:F-box domain-containing protein n=1 Tax=Panicum virgatum TaxID=38727 RepID=A0A8T0V4L5_PANVG|nr:uncharacterized protein LOC120699468 [Panicum virgatum]KAG2629317.1 hypothetical protein PVAP13_3KG424400 [Panicum virgatum]